MSQDKEKQQLEDDASGDSNYCCENGVFGQAHNCRKQPTKESWEVEFDEKIRRFIQSFDSYDSDATKIAKKFISNLLSQALQKQREELYKTMNEMKFTSKISEEAARLTLIAHPEYRIERNHARSVAKRVVGLIKSLVLQDPNTSKKDKDDWSQCNNCYDGEHKLCVCEECECPCKNTNE